MKYNYFKIFKFSTITKNINLIKDSFISINKRIKKIPVYIVDIINQIVTNLRKLILRNFFKYLDIRRYDFYRIDKKNIRSIYKQGGAYFALSLTFIIFIYLVVPKFYSYDKLKIKKIICQNNNVSCSIKGKIYYSFYPTPRIKIKDIIIKDTLKNKNILGRVKSLEVLLSAKNLWKKEKHKYTKIKINNFQINLDYKNLKKYKNIYKKRDSKIPIDFNEGKIIFVNNESYVATIDNVNLHLKFIENSFKAVLKGKFLNDNIYFNLENKLNEGKLLTDILIKMSDMNLVTKINYFNSKKDKDITNGNLTIKKDKNKVTAVFSIKDDKFIINKANLRNTFLDGKVNGEIIFLPYFNFDLDVNLYSLSFTKLYNYFLSLDEKKQKNFFKINKKINGRLSLSSDKIYSSYNLVKSIESRIKFNNGNILIEQLLMNLGKLGASDFLGAINNDKKIPNFRFESNIFVDNQKKFLSKFGIYNKKNIDPSFFISGNFDLQNLRMSFYEISGNEKLKNDDVNFIEQEFNDFMLEDGFKTLFLFPKLKEFTKSITSEPN